MSHQRKLALREALIAQWISRMPWQIRLCLSLLAITAGIIVIARPTTSLDLLARMIGIVAIVEGLLTPGQTRFAVRWRILAAGAWITVGTVVLLAPWLTVLALTILVGVGLAGIGIYRIVMAIRERKTLDERIASIVFGCAAIVFGVVAFFWSDISLIVLSVVFGAWLIIVGVDAGWKALPRTRSRRGRRRRTGWRRFGRSITALVTASAAVIAVGITVTQTGVTAVTDTFYAAPRDVPDSAGKLLTVESFERGVPDGSVGFRFLYTTLATDGSIRVASAIAISPDDDDLHPSISWAHSTTGISQQCAPSLANDPFRYGGMFAAKQIIRSGWALIAPDYVGLGTEGDHSYLLGEDTARQLLDATRAAHSIEELRINHTTVIWGHSQGGHAALWASKIAAKYAPELDVRGVAAMSPVSNLISMVDSLDSVTGGMVFASFVLSAYQKAYPDIDPNAYLRPGVEVAARELPQRCLTGPGSWTSVFSVGVRLADPSIFRVDPRTGTLGARLHENIPKPSADEPLLIAAGTADPLIAPSVQDGYVSSLCKADIPLAYEKVEGADHISMLYSNSTFMPKLLKWTENRFKNLPAKSTC